MRKRKRTTYQPNEKERLAEARHSAAEPALHAAVAAFKSWLKKSGYPNLESALESSQQQSRPCNKSALEGLQKSQSPLHNESTLDYSQRGLPLSNAFEASASQSPSSMDPAGNERRTVLVPSAAESNPLCNPNCLYSPREHQAGAQAQVLSTSVRKEPDNQNQALDLLALAELQHLLRPKFSFREEKDKELNLFNCLVCNDSSREREATAHESHVLIPSKSSFFIADMTKFRLLLRGMPHLQACSGCLSFYTTI